MTTRMSLANVVTGKVVAPFRELLYGPEGIGKTTFGVGAPAPIILGAEEGARQFDVARFPTPRSFEDVLDAIMALGSDAHDYRTLVVDTVDWIEPWIWRTVCARGEGPVKDRSIEDFGYGKGYVYALDEWRKLLSWLERLQAKRAMHVILLAHAQIKTFKNPEGDDYDRWTLKLNDKAGALLKEWCESVLFANYEVTVRKSSAKAYKGKAVAGARWLYSQRQAAFDAKTRYHLPPKMRLSFAEFAKATGNGDVTAPTEPEVGGAFADEEPADDEEPGWMRGPKDAA